jgi:hypothetical protein
MRVIDLGVRRQRKVAEVMIMTFLAVLAVCFMAWDARVHPVAMPDWTVEPLQSDGRAVCPVEFPKVMWVDYDQETVTCETE